MAWGKRQFASGPAASGLLMRDQPMGWGVPGMQPAFAESWFL